jgi:hypothetical protein
MNQKRLWSSTGYRDWLVDITSPKDALGKPEYPNAIRDTAKSGIGRLGNRRLSYLVEFIFVNVGGSDRNVKASSLLMSGMSVGGPIVVRGWESQPQGEGDQEINVSRQESNSEFEESQTGRKARRYEIV